MQTQEKVLASWQESLAAELNKAVPQDGPWIAGFDMKEDVETPGLSSFPRLEFAMQYLNKNLISVWHDADSDATRYQKRHRSVAFIAIGAATVAIILAVIQMAVSVQLHVRNNSENAPATQPPSQESGQKYRAGNLASFGERARVLELVATVAAAAAVACGLWLKFNRKWLCERNRAEQLRMLKFRAFGWNELWLSDVSTWENRLHTELVQLREPISEAQLHRWCKSEHAIPETSAHTVRLDDSLGLAAVQFYYRTKRLDFQSRYLKRRSSKLGRVTRLWHRVSPYVFWVATGCVLVHFSCDWLLEHWDNIYLHAAAIWGLAFAVIVPTVGLGFRGWVAAFEPHRSANLYACKHETVQALRQQMENLPMDSRVWAQQVAAIELFFENEHREWLRLMLEAEWVL